MSKATVDIEQLRAIHLFKPLNKAQLQRVFNTARIIRLGEGESLFTLGQQAHYFYQVVSGQLKLFLVSEDGNEKIIEFPSQGRLFAEAVMFMGSHRYPINATALRDSVVYGFHNQTYLELLQESSELCFALFADISHRLHRLLIEIDQLTLQNATYRVVEYLSNLRADTQAQTVIVDLGAPKQTIAARLSITPETFSRILRTMADADIISIHGKTIGIHDYQRLKEFAHNSRALYGHRDNG